MEQITIPRTGAAPLSFRGVLVAQTTPPAREHRWHELEVYRTDRGRYVLVIDYVTRWRGETGHTRAVQCADMDALRDALTSIDPTWPVQGYPPTAAYADRQQRLLQSIRQRWEQLVGDVLGQLGITEEVQ